MAMALPKSRSEMTREELEEEELNTGPFSIMADAVRNNTQVLINMRNDKTLLCRVKAFDNHSNMVLEGVKEIWQEKPKGGKGKKKQKPVDKERFIGKMFLRGDNVVSVTSNPTVTSAKIKAQDSEA